jgi:hypothetical protein
MVDGINTDSLSAYQKEIIDTLTALGIDAEINLFDADGVYNADLLSNEELSPYFQLAVVQLAWIISPELNNSEQFDTYEEIRDTLGTELTNWLIDTVMSNPEMMMTTGVSESEINYIMDIIYSDSYLSTYGDDSEDSTDSDDASYSEDSRAQAQEWGLSSDFEFYADSYDSYNASIMAVLEQLNQISQAKIVTAQAMLDPDAAGTTIEQLNYEMESNMASEQALLNQLTFLNDGLTTFTESFTKLLESVTEMNKTISRNYV